ncbi:MAG: hypothetical protein IJI67_05820 [Clostridia bacterium]|nr:hypothetical protein [Clostridia bacterium]
MANPILSKQSNDKVTSPEQLNDYIKVSNVGVWLVLLMIFALLVGVFVWACFGSLKEVVDTTGVAQSGTVTCYITDNSKVSVGNEVKIGELKGTVVSVSETPLSNKEISQKYDEYTAYCLALQDWNYEVTISCTDCEDGLQGVKIIHNTIKPISYVKGEG